MKHLYKVNLEAKYCLQYPMPLRSDWHFRHLPGFILFKNTLLTILLIMATGGGFNLVSAETVGASRIFITTTGYNLDAQPFVVVNSSNSNHLLFLTLNNVFDQVMEVAVRFQFLIVLLIFILIGLVVLFIYIYINRTQKTAKWSREEKTRSLYQKELTNFLYEEDHRYFEFTGLHKATNRVIFIDELLRLHSSLLGESRTKIQDLYFNLGLFIDSKNKLNSRLWSIKAKGFRELAQMDVKDAAKQIEKYAFAKNKILRMEALIALIKLNSGSPLEFLNNFTYPLTEWEQINILNTIEAHEIVINSFEEWMTNKNDTIVIFALKLCSFYNHIHSWGKVLDLLDHKSHDVRYHAVKTLDKFSIVENKEPLKQFFFKQALSQSDNNDLFKHQKLINNKLATLKALSSLTTWEDAWFYKLVLSNPSEDFYVLKAAYEQLHRIVSNAGQMIEDLNTPAFRTIVKLKDHFTQYNLTP